MVSLWRLHVSQRIPCWDAQGSNVKERKTILKPDDDEIKFFMSFKKLLFDELERNWNCWSFVYRVHYLCKLIKFYLRKHSSLSARRAGEM